MYNNIITITNDECQMNKIERRQQNDLKEKWEIARRAPILIRPTMNNRLITFEQSILSIIIFSVFKAFGILDTTLKLK